MIQLTPQMKILCFTQSCDFRNGIDGLVGLCKAWAVGEDPFSGTLFLFKNKKGTAIKGIVYDGQGYWLFMKRLSEGRFRFWPKSNEEGPVISKLLSRELSVILWNGDPCNALMGSDFKQLNNTC